MKKQAFFIGEKQRKNYFEGWYFKQVWDQDQAISFIPGISFHDGQKEAFIQIIETIYHQTYYISFPINQVTIGKNNSYIQIGDNYFSKDKVIINIHQKDLHITCKFTFKNHQELKKSLYRPTIMGPFSYIKNMECNHGIISLYHDVYGFVKINHLKQKVQGTGYIEKDYGSSFPKKYLWIQSNTPKSKKEASFFLSYAHIPLGKLHFNGFISVFLLEGKQYFFTTYDFSKINIKRNPDSIQINLKNKTNKIIATIYPKKEKNLIAPIQGSMKQVMKESLSSTMDLKFYQKKKLIYQDSFFNVGFEDVQSLQKE